MCEVSEHNDHKAQESLDDGYMEPGEEGFPATYWGDVVQIFPFFYF